MRLFILIMGLMVLGFAFPVHAQETVPDDPCDPAEENFIRQVGGPETTGIVHLMRCDGISWQQYMTVNESGNIGIGEINPLSALHISGDANSSSSRYPRIVLEDTASGGSQSSSGILVFNHSGFMHDSDGLMGSIVFHGDTDVERGSPAAKIEVWSDTSEIEGKMLFTVNPPGPQTQLDAITIRSSGNVGIQNVNPGAELDVAGSIFYTGIIRDQSDRRQKEDIRQIGPALDKLRQIEGVSFVMKDDPKRMREMGVIAQDVRAVYPDLVIAGRDGILGLNYNGLIAPLIEAVKELDDQDAEQDEAYAAEIARLEAENAELRRMIHEISNRMDVIEGKRRPPLKPYNQ